MFKQILQIEGRDAPPQLDGLAPALRRAKAERDLLAHGIWGKEPNSGELAIQWTSGKWEQTPDGPSGSRKITPAGLIINIPTLEAMTETIDKAISMTEAYFNVVFPEDA